MKTVAVPLILACPAGGDKGRSARLRLGPLGCSLCSCRDLAKGIAFRAVKAAACARRAPDAEIERDLRKGLRAMTTNLAELAALVGGEVSGDDQLIVTGAATLSAARTGDITLADSAEKLLRLAHSAASAAVVSKSLVYQGLPTIRVDDVHAAFAKIVCR